MSTRELSWVITLMAAAAGGAALAAIARGGSIFWPGIALSWALVAVLSQAMVRRLLTRLGE